MSVPAKTVMNTKTSAVMAAIPKKDQGERFDGLPAEAQLGDWATSVLYLDTLFLQAGEQIDRAGSLQAHGCPGTLVGEQDNVHHLRVHDRMRKLGERGAFALT